MFNHVIIEAKVAAQKAFDECKPTPVTMKQGSYTEVWEHGDCGGAYIVISGRGKFAKYAKETLDASRNVMGSGLNISVPYDSHGINSYEKSKAAAEAFAEVLKNHGIERASVRSYID